LFVDSASPEEQNYARVLEFVKSPEIALEPLQIQIPLIKGQYHK